MTNYILITVAILVLQTGCTITRSEPLELYAQISKDSREASKQVSLASGSKKFDFPPNELMKAIIVASSNNNLAVVNIDNDIGFVIAEGPSIISPEEERRHCEENLIIVKQQLPVGANARCEASQTRIRITGTIDSKDGKTSTARLGISAQNTSRARENGIKIAQYDELGPWATQRTYDIFWHAIDKALFIQKNTK